MAKTKRAATAAPPTALPRTTAPAASPFESDPAALPADQVSRDRILSELDRCLLVEAAAGTGKTTSMIGRMTALIREGVCRIETLAAVTFTRKSAAELRARFQIALAEAARAPASPGQQRCALALTQLERCFIGTIHAFCGRLLRERPLEAGVELDFTELDEETDRDLVRLAWEEHAANWVAMDDAATAAVAAAGLEIDSLRGAFEMLARNPDVAEWPAEPVPPPDPAPLLAELDEYVLHIQELIPTFPNERGTDKLMDFYEQIPRLARLASRESLPEVMQLFGRFKASTRITQKAWPGGAPRGKLEKERWEAFTDRATALLARWREHRYPLALAAVRPALAIYDRRRREQGGLNFQDLLLLSAELLRDKPSVREYFRRRYTHLLVDEFQDTDPLQAEVMLLLTADDPRETNWRSCRPVPGALFVVGDPKQSIYRFRRADIVIYNQVKQIVLQAGGDVLPLICNFRTRGDLVAWANRIFDEAFPPAATTYAPARAAMQALRRDVSSGALNGLHRLLVPVEENDDAAAVQYEADFIARWIRQAIDDGVSVPRTQKELDLGASPALTPGDILIITRKKKPLAAIARELQSQGLPFQATGGRALREAAELALLSQLLTAVVRPDDGLALAAVLRSELFGISDAALYDFRKAGGRFRFLSAVPTALPPEIAAEFSAAFDRLRQAASWLRILPPLAAMERIAADVGLLARAAAAQGGNVRAGSLAKAIHRLRAAESKLSSAADPVALLAELIASDAEFDSLPARPPVSPVIRLMNLHKVKGLEAPVVFLAGLGRGHKFGADLHIDRAGDRVRGYLAVSKKQGNAREILAHPKNWEAMQEEEDRFAEAEEIRLLYVAATRAG